MIIAVKKWGNSLGVRIPKKIADKIDLAAENEIELSVFDNSINIRKTTSKETLESLVSEVTEDNKHNEIQRTPLGNEI